MTFAQAAYWARALDGPMAAALVGWLSGRMLVYELAYRASWPTTYHRHPWPFTRTYQ